MDSASTITTEQSVAPEAKPRWFGKTVRRATAVAANPSVRRGVLSVVDQAVVSGTSFATSVIIGRLCSQAELGVYYLALSIVLFVRAVQSDVISAPYMIYCNRRKGETLAAYSGSTLAHQFILSAVTIAGLICLLGALSLGAGPAGLSATVWVLLGAVPFLLLREYVRHFSFSHLQMGTAITLDVVVSVLQLGGLLLLAYFGMLTVELVYVVMGACCALACAGWFLTKQQPMRVRSRSVIADWWDNWTFGKWALAGQLTGRAAGYLMPWIIALIHGETATGVLAACITLVNLAGTFISGVSNFLTPQAAHAFAHGGHDALRRVLWRTAAVFLVTVGAFCLVVLLLGDFLAVFIFGSQFTGCGLILTILAFGMLINSLGLTVGNGLWAIDQPRANFAADLCTLAVTMAAVLCLVYPLSVTGAAIAILAGAVVGAAVRGYTLHRLLQTASWEPPSA
jgi:O-antigen/teichoic acid export membrane protein